MGRTIPSFRLAEMTEVREWKPYRKALPRGDKAIFDEMLGMARLYTSASSAAVRPSRFEGLTMAVIFHHQRLLTQMMGTMSEMGGSGE